MPIEVKEQCKSCFHFQVCANVLKQQLFAREIMLKEENPKCEYYIPTADVVEVKHGRKIVHKRHRGFHSIDCPLCNGSFQSNEPYSEEVEYCSECGKKLDDTFQNYCPHCGAKMDGERRCDR